MKQFDYVYQKILLFLYRVASCFQRIIQRYINKKWKESNSKGQEMSYKNIVLCRCWRNCLQLSSFAYHLKLLFCFSNPWILLKEKDSNVFIVNSSHPGKNFAGNAVWDGEIVSLFDFALKLQKYDLSEMFPVCLSISLFMSSIYITYSSNYYVSYS